MVHRRKPLISPNQSPISVTLVLPHFDLVVFIMPNLGSLRLLSLDLGPVLIWRDVRLRLYETTLIYTLNFPFQMHMLFLVQEIVSSRDILSM